MCGRFALGASQDGDELANDVRRSFFQGRDMSEEFEEGDASTGNAEASRSGTASGSGSGSGAMSSGEAEAQDGDDCGASAMEKVQWKDSTMPERYRKRYNISPTTYSPILTRTSSSLYTLSFSRFGLIPQFQTNQKLTTINCRSDTLFAGGGLWGGVRGKGRCVVIMDGWYEWEVKNEKTRLPWFMRRRQGGMLALAGLCDILERDNEPPNPSFAVITVDAPKPLRFLHDRSPAILHSRKAILQWLDPGPWEPTKHEKLIRTLTEKECKDHIEWYRVIEDVGKVGVDREDLTKPIAERKGNIANMFAAQATRQQSASPKKPPPTPLAPKPKPTPTSPTASKPKITRRRSRSSSIEIIEEETKPKKKQKVVKKKEKETDEHGNATLGNFFKAA